jgi:hypothetical protein
LSKIGLKSDIFVNIVFQKLWNQVALISTKN